MATISNKSFNISPWPLGIVAFLLVVAAVNGFMVMKANEAPDKLVATDYYAQALQYEQVIEAEAISAQSGWKLQVTPALQEKGTLLTFSLQDRDQRPLEKLTAKVQVYRPADPALDQELTLSEQSPGQYIGQSERFPKGLWKLKVTFQDHQQQTVFYQKLTLKLH